MYQQLRLQPYAVHTTFQYAGTEGKRHRLREGMFFYDPKDYYDPPGTLSCSSYFLDFGHRYPVDEFALILGKGCFLILI